MRNEKEIGDDCQMIETYVGRDGTRTIEIDRNRDDLLTEFGKETLRDRYLLAGESFQDLFARVATYYSDDDQHAQRLYDYISKHWFMPATPILSNGGSGRALSISCFLNDVDDNLHSIVETWNENVWLAANGGGIGTHWGNLRSIGEDVKRAGKTSGIIPFIRVMDSLTLAISQGSLRRGAAAVYLPVWHPEIEEFIELRRPTGGDPNRKALNLHHGVCIPNSFYEAVKTDSEWELKSPKTGETIRTVKARDLWIRILTCRVEQGEPYILNIDHVNDAIPEHHKKAGLKVKQSNLCSEITLPTGIDHHGNRRTAVCCLSSYNLEYYDEWKNNTFIMEDVLRFLDNVLEDFIQKAPVEMKDAIYSASRERSIGLGVMGLQAYFQKKGIPMDSVVAESMNVSIFKNLKKQADAVNEKLADEKGACPDADEFGIRKRFSNIFSIAPTATISIIAGNSSPGIEPHAANAYNQKTLSGTFLVKNRILENFLRQKGKDDEDTWQSITLNEGSVQHLDFMTDEEKSVFKTSFEIDQMAIIRMAAARTKYICQSQSVNLFIPADIHKRDLHQLHMTAWELGMKSLYYCRSKSLKTAEAASNRIERAVVDVQPEPEVCESCQ